MNDNKIVPKEIITNISEFSLAVWFMDDGFTDWNERSIKRGWKCLPSSTLCTDSFSFQECELIKESLKKFKLETYIKTKREDQFHIKFNTVNTARLFEIIKAFILPSMSYKINYDAYKSHLDHIKDLTSERRRNIIADLQTKYSFGRACQVE